MLTKGIILGIDYNSNKCIVRMPIFESASSTSAVIAPAIFAISPGEYNGYKPGDVVILGFESNHIQYPVVLGKLYLGSNTENGEARGVANIKNLKVTDSATIPTNTTFILPKTADTIVSNLEGLQTVEELINTVKQNTIDIENKTFASTFTEDEQLIGKWVDDKSLFRNTFIIVPETTIDTGTIFSEELSLDIDFETIWLDPTHTVQIGENYSLPVGSGPDNSYFNAYIDITNKKLYYAGKSPDKIERFIITIEYTKK